MVQNTTESETNKSVDNCIGAAKIISIAEKNERQFSHRLDPVLARLRRMQRLPAIITSIEQERTRTVIARDLERVSL
jgi:hypothetical protein